ncbi:hypothetical protein [uncultured Draconibacterium sp.]|uniref:hypothetical protein n=1 Tax=uncultured Draconibacterium sp. TaxID=1573823 RepID=UPI003216A5FF
MEVKAAIIYIGIAQCLFAALLIFFKTAIKHISSPIAKIGKMGEKVVLVIVLQTI